VSVLSGVSGVWSFMVSAFFAADSLVHLMTLLVEEPEKFWWPGRICPGFF
jgi:hypothetical protein